MLPFLVLQEAHLQGRSEFHPDHTLPGLLVNAGQVGFTALASNIGAGASVEATFFLTRPGISRTCVGNSGQNSSKFGSIIGRETARTRRDVGGRWSAAAEAGNDAIEQCGVRQVMKDCDQCLLLSRGVFLLQVSG